MERKPFALPALLLLAALPLAAPISAPISARAPSQAPAGASDLPPHFAALPPELRWAGKSLELALPPDHEWATPFEQSGLTDSPDYATTVAWLQRLAAATPKVRLVSLGKSPEGRDIWMVVASAEGAGSPGTLSLRGKPTVLAQAGIHSGEIDGKDAGLMLLRDMTVLGNRSELLERANFLFVPIFSVDAHERRTEYGRINQRGPLHTGWRTSSRNLNLNRDYAKLDMLEMRHMLAAIEAWHPDLYLDLHVTDGADYQYDVTFGWNRPPATWSPAIDGWLESVYRPAVNAALSAEGHIPGGLTFTVDPWDWKKGIARFTAPPRFSNGYGDARHLPTVLVENHSLKPYRQRVLGMYVLLDETLRLLGERGAELRAAIDTDRAARPATVALDWKQAQGEAPPTEEFLGVGERVERSAVSGGLKVIWTGEPETAEVPVFRATVPSTTVERPAAYWIPPAYRDVIERLALHGIAMERIEEPREVDVEVYRLTDAHIDESPFEGRVRASATPVAERRRQVFPPGSVRVSTDQPLGDLAVLLLEPGAPDSFFQWGFFHEVLSRTEYAEGYVMEPMAERMLAEDSDLAAEYLRKLEQDADFRGDPRARLQWFYERTPYYDERHLLYPVAREMAAE